MQAVTPMTLHMDSPMTLERVYAKQNDKFSRYILADLFAGASAWTPPADAAAIIRYRKPDGTSGFYDVDEAGRQAVTRDGSSVKLYLAEQVLTVPGVVPMELNFYSPDGGKLTSFAWDLIVKPSVVPDDAIQSTDYYNGLTATVSQAVEAASNASASAQAAASSAAALSQYIGQDGNLVAPHSLQVGYGAELGQNASGHGGFIDFHFDGAADDYTSRLIENSRGILELIGSLRVDNALLLSAVAKSMLYSQTNEVGNLSSALISAYPTRAGVYLVGDLSGISGMPSTAGSWGVLVIINAGGYAMHVYLDGSANLFWARTDGSHGATLEAVGKPSGWHMVSKTDIGVIT